MTTTTKRKISNLHVKSIEEEILLIKEWEADYNNNWWKDARQAYIDGLKYFDNLK